MIRVQTRQLFSHFVHCMTGQRAERHVVGHTRDGDAIVADPGEGWVPMGEFCNVAHPPRDEDGNYLDLADGRMAGAISAEWLEKYHARATGGFSVTDWFSQCVGAECTINAAGAVLCDGEWLSQADVDRYCDLLDNAAGFFRWR